MNCLVLLLAAALSSGNAEFEKASVDAAADIALGQLKAEIADRGLATNALERAMLADPVAYRTRQDAERLCRGLYRGELERCYRERSEAILRGLGLASTNTPPDTNLLNQAAERHFARAFDAERKAACDEQAAHIALKVKPDEADLETKGDDEARAWLTDRIASAKGSSVFEENLKYISEKIVDPILEDARKERKRQKEYLMLTRCESCAPSALSKEIEANLRRDVAKRNGKEDNPLKAWGVFPQTLKAELPVAVERRVIARTIRCIEDVQSRLDEESVRKTIESNPAVHRTPSESERIFHGLLTRWITDSALEKAESSAPAAERTELGAYLREHAQSPEFAKAVDRKIRSDALPKWRKVRKELAEDETRRRWPTLIDRTWYPDAELADLISSRSDYEIALRDWRKAPELSDLAGNSAAVYEESDLAADKSVAAAFNLARDARTAQLNIVEQMHPLILTAAKDLSKGIFSSKPDLAIIVEMLTESVKKGWDETREKTLWIGGSKPLNAKLQHSELFPSVRREIERVARQILEEVEKREKVEVEEKKKAKDSGEGEEKKPEAEQKPESNPDESMPAPPKSDEQPPKESKDTPSSGDSSNVIFSFTLPGGEVAEGLVAVSFKQEGDDVTVFATSGKTVIAEVKEKATANGFAEAFRKVGETVAREHLKLR